MTDRTDSLSTICEAFAAYRSYQDSARGTFGPVADAWRVKVERARERVRLAIFALRADDYERAM